MTIPTDTLRRTDLQTLATALNDIRTRSLDVVMAAKSLTFEGGSLRVSGMDAQVSEDGVTVVNGLYTPTRIANDGLASKLEIPVGYLNRCFDTFPELYAENLNAWLQRSDKRFLVRMLTTGDGEGIVRAVLSDTYRRIDNFDVLLASLKGIKEAGIQAPQITADLTERRMVVRVQVPEIAAMAPALLKDYRSPFSGERIDTHGWTPERMAQHNADVRAGRGGNIDYAPGDPVMFAGLVITNSETGGGAFNIGPELTVRICDNGMAITADALRKVHLGARMDDEGVVKWSEATAAANLALVTSQTTDAVRTFVSLDYLTDKVAELEKAAGVEITDAPKVLAAVGKAMGFTEAESSMILQHFISGGQPTAGGVLQAVTSAAQTLPTSEEEWDMKFRAIAAMNAAVALVTA